MTTFVNHDTYGQIVYNENFWTGKKDLMVNGKYLTKIDKKTFRFTNGEEEKYFIIGGNFLRGAYITVGSDKIQLTPPIKWYEATLPILLFITLLVWGSSPQLVSIFPLVGGAIGGLINAVGMILSMLTMKSIKKIWLKLFAWLGISALNILANFLICSFLIASFM